MRTISTIFAFIFLALSNIVAQSFETANVRAASNSIPSDNTLRYYRLAIPVTRTAYEEDLGGNYNNVLQFWRECEEFANRMFVPLGICFNVIEDQRLIKSDYFTYEDNVYTLQANGTTNTNDLIGADSYDVAMWVHHRDISAENSGLSVEGGVYNSSTKGSGYSKTDKWVVAHELGHMFGAPHTTTGEGSLMDSGGDDFFSYPSIKMIRDLAVGNGASSANNAVEVSNSAPVFTNMKDSYRIPQGACIAIPVYANDADGNTLTYSAIGCSSSIVGNIIEGGYMPHFASLIPQTSNVIDYRPKFTADIYSNGDYYYEQSGTNIPAMSAGSYNIAILVNDVPASMEYDYLTANPFYSNYAVWDATVQIVGGTAFNASMSPAKNSYSAGEQVTVSWGVNSNYFTADSRLRITMSTDYGKTFAYLLADNVPALDGSKAVTLPDINVGNIDVDFKTATRSKPGGIIRVEEIGGVAYTLTTLDPTDGKGFNITGGSGAPITYTISVTAGDGGTATIGGKSSTTVTAGSSVTLTATPNDGYIFDGWYSGGKFVSLDAKYTFTPTASGTYNAQFEEEAGTPVTYEITATANPIEGGTVTGGGTYNESETVTLTANANNGYNFTGWYNGQDFVSNENPYTFIATASGTYNALFEKEAGTPVTYKITATANPIEGGNVTGGGTYNEGATVTLTATPNNGYEFVNWTKGGIEVSTNATYSFTANATADYVANFKEDGSGSDPQPSTGLGGKWYRIKDNASGKYIDINKDGATDASHGNVIMSDKDEDSKRQIIYFETSGDGYKLKAATGDYIKCEQWNVSAGDANSAATLIFEETGDLYYIKWNHTSYQNNIYYFKVENAKGGDYALHPYDDAASTSTAAKWKLEEVKYTISVSASEGGTAEVATGGGGGAASVEVPYDGSATLTASPASGFKFVNWTKGGTLFSEEAELTVSNIQANAEYVANFEADGLTTGYYHIVSRATDRNEHLYNNAFSSDNTNHFTLQSNTMVNTNNGIWYITKNGNQLGIKNGDGKPVVAGDSNKSIMGTFSNLNIHTTINDAGDGYTYYYFNEALNCSKSDQDHFKVGGINFLTTWSDHPNATDNQWRFERVDTEGKNIYNVVVECTDKDVYVTYGSEYAFDGGFFITNEIITAQQLTAKKNNAAAQDVTISVEGNTIRVVDTEYVDITVSTTPHEGGSVTINSEATGTKRVIKGSSVTLNATPASGYRFLNWSDAEGIVSETAEYTFTANSATTLTANFERITYTVNVNANPIEGGNVTGGGTYNEGETVTLTANANNGYNFTGWYNGQDLVSNENPYTFVLEGNINYEARFEVAAPVTYTITARANPEEAGNVTGGGIYNEDATVTLTATPNSGYEFVNWTSGTTTVSTDATYSFTANASAEYIANFKEEAQVQTYKITATANPIEGGTATVNDKALVEVEANGTIELSAKANSGYEFVNWTSGGKEVTTQTDYIIYNVAGDADYIANFKLETTATEYPTPTGKTYTNNYLTSITTTGGDTNIEYSANAHPEQSLVVVPGKVQLEKGKSFTMSLIANSLGAGSNSITREDMRYCHASLFTDFDQDFTFEESPVQTWGVKGPSETNPYAGGNSHVYGNYDLVMNITHTITVPDDAPTGESHVRMIYTNAWKGWPTNGTAELDKGIVYDIVVEIVEKVDITANASKGGSVTINDEATGTKRVIKGSSVTLNATPDDGYKFANWSDANGVVSETAEYTFTANSATTLTANFERRKCTIHIQTNSAEAGSATVNESTSSVTIDYGASITLVAEANENYEFMGWEKDGVRVAGVGITEEYTIYGITFDATFTAIFSRITDYTQLEDGVAYNIRGRMEDGSYGYVYCNGTNLKYSIMDEDEDELSSDRYIFVVQKTDDKKVNLISALGYYGWNQDGTLSNEYANIEIANGIGMEGRTLYSATGTDFYTFSTDDNEIIKATKDDAINKSVAGDVTSDFDFVKVTDYKFNVNVADGSNAELGTINLPFATKLPDGIKAYKAEVQNDDLVMTELDLTDKILPANTPVLIEGTSSGEFGFAPAPASDETYDTGFSGTLDAKDIDSNVKAYILSYDGAGSEIKFYKLSSTNRKINANKAYFVDYSTGSSATAFRIRFAGVTGIDGIEEENEMHESVYDLQGRKLEKVTSPGIYIVDGKKKYIK